MANLSLQSAKDAKNDEFYTRIEDINEEMNHYEDKFRDKIVFCNCDDPTWSNFWKYFHMNFEYLGLKKLIATHYEAGEVQTYKIEYTGGNDLDFEGGVVTPLAQNGDFRSDECIELLKEADIVVTNPPFSLFREYVATLIQYNKQFIILGNMNAITYKEIFPLLKNNEMWLGCRSLSKDMYFDVPEDRRKWLVENKKEGSAYKVINGVVMGRLASACWFTNLDHSKRHELLETTYCYAKKDALYPDLYPKYDNYDAINVDKVSEIPCDYEGVMGVPITFLDKHNPEQYMIVGLAPERLNPNESSLQIKRYVNAVQHKKDGTTCSGNKVNDGPVIVHDNVPSKFPYYTSETVPDKYLEVLYARILIRRKA